MQVEQRSFSDLDAFLAHYSTPKTSDVLSEDRIQYSVAEEEHFDERSVTPPKLRSVKRPPGQHRIDSRRPGHTAAVELNSMDSAWWSDRPEFESDDDELWAGFEFEESIPTQKEMLVSPNLCSAMRRVSFSVELTDEEAEGELLECREQTLSDPLLENPGCGVRWLRTALRGGRAQEAQSVSAPPVLRRSDTADDEPPKRAALAPATLAVTPQPPPAPRNGPSRPMRPRSKSV